MVAAIKQSEFIDRCVQRYGDKYDYSETVYKNRRTKVKIICRKHGTFQQLPLQHSMGRGCKQCGVEQRSVQSSLGFDGFVDRARQVHGDRYQYPNADYTNQKTKILILCPNHGEFKQTAGDHLNGSGCQKCSTQKVNRPDDTNTFITKAVIVHGDKYDYSKVVYCRSRIKVVIVCDRHGEFRIEPAAHVRGVGCAQCKASVGERQVASFLNRNGVRFESQWSPQSLRHKRPLRFDFKISDQNIVIEFDGIQHYQPVDAFGGTKAFTETKLRDSCKNQWADENQFRLIRIGYLESVDETLAKQLEIV